MKHLLNDLSEHEKNHIREQHTDKIKIDTSKFRRLMESKLGNVRPIMEGPGENQPLPQANAALTNTSAVNQTTEIPKGAQEPQAIEGKSITLYMDEDDAKKAFQTNKSNPRSIGAITGIISKIEYAMDRGVEFDINVYNLAKDPKGTQVATPVLFNKETGSFRIPSRGDMDFYNEGLKQAFDRKYYQTDFASTQKPASQMTEEDISGPKRNIEKDLEPNDVLHLIDKNNSKDEAVVLQVPQPNQGLSVKHKGKETKFFFGPGDNQVRVAGTRVPGDFDFTIESVEIEGKSYPVQPDGSF